MKSYHSLTYKEALKNTNSNEEGLTSAVAKELLKENGKNELEGNKRKKLFLRFLDQMKDTMILVLLIAAGISAVIAISQGHYLELVDSGIILLIVILNAIIGLTQENKAHQAMEALKGMNKPLAKVLRDGEITKIRCEEIVVGDIISLEAGDIVPADIRLIESTSLKIEEATLTGESLPSEKDANIVLKEDTPLGDRANMVYSSGIVSYGRGKGVVVATGMKTEVGKIATMLNSSEEIQTPLQTQLAKTAKFLSILVLAIAGIIFAVSIINKPESMPLQENIMNSFMTAVAIAVAAIPEGLPAVVTIVLAIGVKRMSEKNAIIKNLPAVETLGCCQVVCSDKTGTLTLNKMTVKELYTTSQGLTYKQKLSHNDKSERELITGLVLCNDTVITHTNSLLGDPTETALISYAKYIGINLKALKNEMPRVAEVPFDSKRKLMTTVHLYRGKKVSYTKGAFDILLNRCTNILDGENIRPITEHDKLIIKQANKNMATDALRVLALALKNTDLEDEKKLEQNLTFVGLVGMIDPPRKEVLGAVKVCQKAGMKAIMITGDHMDTATAIAKQIGIYKEGDLRITGAELDLLSDEEFLNNLHKYSIFARVSPENKVRIVKAFKSFNMIVAMTGDGVNDAPSIKIADIGIGMGITGTDVSKGAADMILSDDNFATIIAAVEEGRKVYSNIKKAVQYLLSANIAEVLCLFIATIFLRVEFLTAVMILWINLVTDSLPALALGTEKAEKDVMNRPPRKSNASLFAGRTGKNILIQGVMQTFLTMTAFAIGDSLYTHEMAITMAFITLSFIQLFHAYNMRSRSSLFSSNPFSNKFLNLSLVIGLVLILFSTLLPFAHILFGTTSLPLNGWLISVGCALAIILLVEIEKMIQRHISNNKSKKLHE